MRSRWLHTTLSLLITLTLLNVGAWPLPSPVTTQAILQEPTMQDDDGDDPCPDPDSKVSVASRKAPTKEQYLALVEDVSKEYAANLKPGFKIQIDQTLFGATRAGYGADLAALFLGIKEGSAAVYLNTWSAKKDPTDFLTANNLGVELKGMNDLDRTLSVMLYAQALEPDAPLTMDNTAWVDIKLGDAASAKGLFERSLKLNKEDEQALGGLALLAQCRGDHYEAARLARQALKNKYLPIAAATLNSANDAIEGGDSSDVTQGGDDGSPPKPPKPPEPGKGSDFVAHQEPIQNPRGKDSECKNLEWKDPPIDPKIETFVASLQPVSAWADDVEKAVTKAGQDLYKAGEPFTTRGNGPQRSGNTIIIPTSNEKEDFVLSDIRRIFSARIGAIMEDFNRRWGPLQEQANTIGTIPDCRPGRPKATTLHNQFVPLFNDTWTKIRKEVNDYQAVAGPWLADIHDPDRNTLENASSEVWIRAFEAEMSVDLRLWAIEMNNLWLPGDSRCEEQHADSRVNPGALKALKTFPEKCYVPTWFVSTSALTYEATCDSIKIEVGKVAVISAEYKFGNDWGDDQIVIFGGAKAKKEIKGLPGAEAGFKVGVEIAINPATGELVDAGLKTTISGKLTIGPKQESGDINPSGEAKFDGRIGLKNPNGSIKAGTKVGVKAK